MHATRAQAAPPRWRSSGLVPARIGQGLRATAAHSTLVLDDANSTAVMLHGKLGKGAETVEVERRTITRKGREATRVEASHDGYAARFGLTHSRILTLSGDGTELAGEDLLVPVSRKGKRGKIGFAIRFHLGRGVETRLSEDGRSASLLWVDGEGRPHATEQLVIEGLTSRGGGQFSWLLKKM